MQEVELVGSHQEYSPFAISIASSGRELYALRRSEVRNLGIRPARCNESAHTGSRRISSGAAREATVWRAPTPPGEGFEVGKLGKLSRGWVEHILQLNNWLLPVKRVVCARLATRLAGPRSARLFPVQEHGGQTCQLCGIPDLRFRSSPAARSVRSFPATSIEP